MKNRKIMKILFVSIMLLSIKVSAETVETVETTNDTNTFSDRELFLTQSQEVVSKSESNPTSESLETTAQTSSDKVEVESTEALKMNKTNETQIEETFPHEKTVEEKSDAKGNLVMNGDFSNFESKIDKWSGIKPKDWGIWIPGDNKITDYITQLNDDNNLMISSLNKDFRAAITQKFDINSSKNYELSFDIKTENLTNIARVRINEQNENGLVNLWHSKSFKGTNDWQKVLQDFIPNVETRFITIELFFEKGTGTVYYDNISLIEKEIQAEDAILLEDKIEIHTNNIYFTQQENYTYEVSDSSIAKQEKGIIYPITEGKTTVKVNDENGLFIKDIPLIVESFEETKYYKMLNQWNDIIAGNDYFNKNNQVMIQQNNELDSAVRNIISLYTYNDNPKTLWSDITDYSISANITISYRRVETIAKQVTQPSSVYYQDKDVIRIARNAMRWMNTQVYNQEQSISGNWWDYEIGAPRAINNSLSLMQQYFNKSEILKYTNAINYFVPDPYHFRVTQGMPFKALGGNLIDMGRVKIISGALREDNGIVSSAIESLQQAFEYASSGEAGFFEDGSYIDHDNVALTGAYGSVLIDGLSQLLPVVLESELLPVNKLDNLYRFIDDSFLPLIYKGEMMDMTRGRAISRQELQSHAAGGEILRGMMRIADSSEENQKKRLNAIIKTVVKQNTYYNIYQSLHSYKDIDLMDQLLTDPSILMTNFHSKLAIFNEMDKVSYQNKEANFGFGLSMYSDTTQNYEYMNQENAHGWYTSDGAIYLYNDDLTHYNDNYWATVDPYHIPGTTIIPKKREIGSGMVTSPNSFVGGTRIDDKTASIVMDFTNWDNTLSANKSWFIFNDKIVFLGSDIQTVENIPAITTIENRKNNENTQYEIFVNGEVIKPTKEHIQLKNVNSILLASSNNQSMNIGYTFLENTSLDLMDKINTGSWKEINTNQSDKLHQNNFLTFYQTHSSEDTTYAYVMYPNISVEQLIEKEKAEKVRVLQNDGTTQAVHDAEASSWGIVLYEDQPFTLNEEITITKKGVYSVRKEEDKYVLSYYHPTDKINLIETIKSSLEKEMIQEATFKNNSTILHIYLDKDESSVDTSTDTSDESSIEHSIEYTASSTTESNQPLEITEENINKEGNIILPKTGEILTSPIVQVFGIALITFVVSFKFFYRK